MSRYDEQSNLVKDSTTRDAGQGQGQSLFFGGIYTLVRYLHKHRNDDVPQEEIEGHFNDGISEENYKTVRDIWSDERGKSGQKASFFNVWLRFTFQRMILQTVTVFFGVLVSVVTSAYLPYLIMTYLEQPYSSNYTPWLFAAAIIVLNIGQTFFFPLYTQLGLEKGHKLRCAMIALCYDKLLKLQSINSSALSNLMIIANQGSQRIINQCQYSFCIPGSIITVIVCTGYMYVLVGRWAFVGMGIFTMFVILRGIAACLNVYLRRRMFIYTEMRIRKLQEIFQSVRLVKMYGWEEIFYKDVEDIRKTETFYSFLALLNQLLATNLRKVSPQIAFIATLYGYYITNNSLDAATSFTVLLLFNVARFQVTLIGQTSQNFGEMVVICQRVNEFLRLPEFNGNDAISRCKNINNAIETYHADFSWNVRNDTKVDLELSSSEYPQFRLSDIHLTIPRKQLVGICGSVASGKSSLLSALMNRMYVTSGTCTVSGTVAYVPQQAWIFNATIRENILFGKKFDQIRYDNVLNACSLVEDMEQLPMNDMTVIGDRGANLSGGQRQRISIARAAYNDSDVCLLDDPLSAMDIHVGKHVFVNCIQRLLKNKTVLLVTHQIQYLDVCDVIIVMHSGSIAERGTHTDLLRRKGLYYKLYENYIKENKPAKDNVKQQKKTKSRTAVEYSDTNNGVLTEKEKILIGAMKTLHKYVQACGGYLMVLFTLFMYVLSAGYQIFVAWWLHLWIDDLQHQSGMSGTFSQHHNISETSENVRLLQKASNNSKSDSFLIMTNQNESFLNLTNQNNPTLNESLSSYPVIFVFSILILIVITVIQCLIATISLIKGSTNIHKQALWQILRTPMIFFDTNPTGRIMNRFSYDFDNIDIYIPQYMDSLVSLVLGCISCLAVIVLKIPWILLLCFPVGIALLFLNKWIIGVLLQTQRLESTSFSPLLSHVSTTASGLANITAFGQCYNMWNKAMRLTDVNGSLMYICSNIKKWQGLIFEICLSTVTIGTMIIIIFTKGWIDSALSGLVLTMCIKAVGFVRPIMFFYSDICSKLVSVERLGEYCDLQEVDKEVTSSKPRDTIRDVTGVTSQHINERTDDNFNTDWPIKGHVLFSNVSMQYRPESPAVLKDISFRALPGENIGIVGRTGAGKSSIMGALFRLYDLSTGHIYIDGVDISTISKALLRNSIINVPQDPVMFSGSIRFNLDPLGTCSDEQLLEVLSQVHMKHKILKLPQKLDYFVHEGGINMSVGERQLLCLGRAILRKPWVLMLDEATASIDTETDVMIQRTIREQFSTCTVITIAHRLNTILHCNRLIVLDHGSLIETGTPSQLLSDVTSEFYSMYHAQSFTNSK